MAEILCQRCRIHPAAYQCPQGKSYCSVSCQVSHFLFIKGLEGATKVAKTQGQEFSPCNTFGREITIPISQIVCGQFRIGANWSAVLAGIECTIIGSRVATSLIRVAATRIFAEPAQCILEPIVNSLDAYHPQNKTGKFGMGFFSLIYWVIQKNATILIESNYMEGNVLCGFSARIWNQGNEVVMITLQDREVNSETSVPKFVVGLRYPNMTNEDVKEFGQQLRKLLYVSLSPILVNGKFWNVESDPNTSKVVEVTVSPRVGFMVQDRATGISRDTFLRYLIVPTVSTKTIQMSVGPVAFTAKPRIITESQPGQSGGRLLVLVNSIVVISLHLAFHTKFVFTIIIDLPPNTRIPVSRDDVFLDSVKFEFEQNMEQLWRLCVGQETVVPLEQMMEFWSSKTSSMDNKLIITNTMQKMRKKFVGNILYVGQQVSPQYDELRAIATEVKIVSSQNWDPEMVEQWVRTKWPVDDSYYVDRSIVFYQSSSALDMPKPFTGGLNSILFVSHLWKDIPLFAEKLAATFYETTLHLRTLVAASESMTESSENFKEIDATKLSSNTKNLLKAIYTYEETCIRVGWVGSVGSVDSWIDACINDVLTDATLQLLVTRLFPLLVASPRPSDYGAGEDNFRGFEWDTRESGFGIPTVQETPFAIVSETDDDDNGELEVVDYIFTAHEIIDNVDLFDKTITFCTELAKILVLRIINSYQHVKEIRLEDIIVNSLFPLLQTLRSFDSWPRKLLLVLIDICKNVQEFYCCYAALAVIGKQKNFQFFLNRKFDDAEYRFMAETLHGLVLKAYNKKPVLDFGYGIHFNVELMHFSNRIPEVVAQSFLELIRISMGDSMTDLARSDPTIRTKSPSAYIEFTLNDFIAESFRRNWSIQSPKEFFDELREIPRERQLTTQMVEIVINEGTTKDPILAQLTELTQNSLDAIRQFKPANSNIEIDIYFSTESDRHLLIWVTDFVGMDPGALVSLSIPFYSNKSISDIVAGEMGTGFFNVYRSKRVRTSTDFNGHRFVFFDEPVYYESEGGRRVKDVKRFASYRPEPEGPNGTLIAITLEYPDQKAALLAMNEAKQFVASVLGLVRLPEGAYCLLNGRPVTKQLKLVEETESFQFYVKEDAEPTTFSSYLMTKGVPFMPLTEYLLMNHSSFDKDLVKFIESNYVMNLKPGAYTPVQSRTKIGLAEKTKHDFEMCVKRQIYASLLSLPIHEISQHFVGLISMNQVEITQVISTTSEPKREATRLREFAMDFAFSGLPSFRGLLAEIYAKWSSQGRMHTTEVRKIFISDEINQNNPFFALIGAKLVETNPTVGLKLWQLAMKWFQNKYYVTHGWRKYEADKRKEYVEIVKTKSALENHQYSLLLGFVQVFVNNYIQIGQRLKLINSDREIPKVEITDIGNSSYSHLQNLLHYRVTETERREQLRMLDTLLSGDTEQSFLTQISAIETNPLWQTTFSPNGTIAHELEHFRRGVSSEGGAHDTIVIDLPFGGLKARDFRLCHGDVMRSLVDQGFWSRVYQDYKKKL